MTRMKIYSSYRQQEEVNEKARPNKQTSQQTNNRYFVFAFGAKFRVVATCYTDDIVVAFSACMCELWLVRVIVLSVVDCLHITNVVIASF